MDRWKPKPEMKAALTKGPYTFALIAVPFLEKYGEVAKKLIHDTLYDMAVDQGKSRAQRTIELGGSVDDMIEYERRGVEDFAMEGLNSPGMEDPAREWIVKTKDKTVNNLRKCGGCETNVMGAWRQLGLDAETIRTLSQIYCWPWDEGARKGFNPRIKFSFNKLEPGGDSYCEFVTELTDEASYESSYHERGN